MKNKLPGRYIFIVLIVIFFQSVNAQGNYTEKDSILFDKYISILSEKKNEPINKLVIESALFFLDSPYVASTLEKNKSEKLVINLHEFDCTTFVENCIALSKLLKSEDVSFSNFQAILTGIRYKNQKIDGYSSRLHYISDWKYENEINRTLQDISATLGGKKIIKTINYMSTHPVAYKQLSTDEAQLTNISKIETEISNRDGQYIVIPKQKISSISKGIKNGDIIVFATTIKGLDYSHIGIAFWVNNELRFIHASSNKAKVVIEDKSLANYCNLSKTCSGITVLRLTD